MLRFATKCQSKLTSSLLVLLLGTGLVACNGSLTPKTGNGKGTTSTSTKTSNKSASTLAGKTTVSAATTTSSFNYVWLGKGPMKFDGPVQAQVLKPANAVIWAYFALVMKQTSRSSFRNSQHLTGRCQIWRQPRCHYWTRTSVCRICKQSFG